MKIMKLFIAEKPELGRAIANGLEVSEKKEGYLICKNNCIVTWAFGHILELKSPSEYDEKYKRWNIDNLPIKVEKFLYNPIKDKKKQLNIIKSLIKDADSLVNCGDMDEEGQILIDEIISYCDAQNKKCERLLINDLTDEGVKKSLKEMKDNKDFVNIANSGYARSYADWIFGLNATRLITIVNSDKNQNDVYPVGRVQTPILALIVNRFEENKNFKKIPYFFISAILDNKLKLSLKTKEKILDEDIAKEIKLSCENTDCILNVSRENKEENPPLSYSLLLLQSDCAKKFKMKPKEVLDITQVLREKHKAITYNRSDCEFLPMTVFNDREKIFESIKKNFNSDAEIFKDNIDLDIKSKAFDDSKITAHTGIVPTAQNFAISNLNEKELKVYKLIVKRFVALFMPNKKFIKTNINTKIKEYEFCAGSIKIIDDGWTSLYKNDVIEKDEKEDDENDSTAENNNFDFDSLNDKDVFRCKEVKYEQKFTKPQPLYKYDTLLKDLTQISKYVRDERLKKALKDKDKNNKGENGSIGTPATRSQHIENLFKRGYITEDKKKNIIPTDKGIELINLLPKSLTTAEMTAKWFLSQEEIRQGNLNVKSFLDEIINELEELIKDFKLVIKNNPAVPKIEVSEILCPTCKKGYLIKRESKNKKGSYWWGCSEYPKCKAIFPDTDGKPNFNFEKKEKELNKDFQCPTCKKGYLQRKINSKGNYWWGCSEYPKCKAMFFDDNGKPKEIKK